MGEWYYFFIYKVCGKIALPNCETYLNGHNTSVQYFLQVEDILSTQYQLLLLLFFWSPEGPVRQIHSPQLHVGAPGVFSDLLRSVQILKREGGAGSYSTYSIPSKTAALVPEFAVEDLPSVELQPRFLRLQWRTCRWAEHSGGEFLLDRNYTMEINNNSLGAPLTIKPIASGLLSLR